MSSPSFLSLVQNVALLLAMALMFDLVATRWKAGKLGWWQVPFGFVLGLMGIALMMTPWVFAPGIIFDTRSVLLSVAGLFFGALPTLIAMLITAAFRIYQGGAAAVMGVSVILATGTIGIAWRHFRRRPLTSLSWRELYFFGLVVHLVMLALTFTLPYEMALAVLSNISLTVLTIYPLGVMLLGLLMVTRLRREKAAEDLARNEIRLRSLIDLLQYRAETPQQFLDLALDEAIRLTDSAIGYIYLYSEQRQELTLNSWSKGVLEECRVTDRQTIFQLARTGVWGEAIRQRKPIIINDFTAANILKKGFPEGHISLKKYLTLPVFNEGQIVAVVGVANKESDYDETDVLQLTLLMDSVWKVTERKRAEDALRLSEENYRQLFEQAADGIFIADAQGNYVEVNPSACALLGYTPAELLSRNIADVISKEDLQAAPLRHVELIERDQGLVTERRMIRKDGSLVDVEISGRRLPDGRLQGMVRDISARKVAEQKERAVQAELKQLLETADQSRRALLSLVEDQRRAEEQIMQLNAELEQRVRDRTAQLEAANHELEAFAYSVSHDLRAPLRAMDGFSSALVSDYHDQLDEQARHYLGRIQEASKRMGQLIEDLLNLSRVTRRELNRERIDLSQLAAEIAAELKNQNPQRQVEFEIMPGMMVQADAHLIRIALENLLNNAYKFTGQREKACIRVGVMQKEGEQTYFVSDNGVGFNMEYAGKLFVPFQRLHGIHEYPGTGIGLVTVQRIITRHGGRIWPEAQVDQGAVFFFTLDGQI